jgi:hypothetical protein
MSIDWYAWPSHSLWSRFRVLPERYDVARAAVHSSMAYYPLRPELAESTYALYRATGSDRYLEMGREMVISLNQIARTPSGFAAVKSVLDMTLEDHTPSFFLAETLKYLYLLFDDDAFPNTHASGYVFSTEGHIIPISTAFPKQPPITAPALTTPAAEVGDHHGADLGTSVDGAAANDDADDADDATDDAADDDDAAAADDDDDDAVELTAAQEELQASRERLVPPAAEPPPPPPPPTATRLLQGLLNLDWISMPRSFEIASAPGEAEAVARHGAEADRYHRRRHKQLSPSPPVRSRQGAVSGGAGAVSGGPRAVSGGASASARLPSHEPHGLPIVELPVSRLRQIIRSAGLSYSDCFERSELQSRATVATSLLLQRRRERAAAAEAAAAGLEPPGAHLVCHALQLPSSHSQSHPREPPPPSSRRQRHQEQTRKQKLQQCQPPPPPPQQQQHQQQEHHQHQQQQQQQQQQQEQEQQQQQESQRQQAIAAKAAQELMIMLAAEPSHATLGSISAFAGGHCCSSDGIHTDLPP